MWLQVAQRLGCQLHGLNLPGHFMLGSNMEGISNLTQVNDPFEGL